MTKTMTQTRKPFRELASTLFDLHYDHCHVLPSYVDTTFYYPALPQPPVSGKHTGSPHSFAVNASWATICFY